MKGKFQAADGIMGTWELAAQRQAAAATSRAIPSVGSKGTELP